MVKLFTDDARTDRVHAMQQTSCDHKPVILTTTMLVNMHKCGKVMHATMRLNRTVTGARSRGLGWWKAGLGLGQGLRRHLTRCGVERGGRE